MQEGKRLGLVKTIFKCKDFAGSFVLHSFILSRNLFFGGGGGWRSLFSFFLSVPFKCLPSLSENLGLSSCELKPTYQ